MSYYEPEDLPKFGDIAEDNKELADAFFSWYGKVFAEGELSKREKNLLALAVSHAKQCPYCIDAYTEACLESGCARGELMEAVHVSAAITGGATLAHAVQMRTKADKLSM